MNHTMEITDVLTQVTTNVTLMSNGNGTHDGPLELTSNLFGWAYAICWSFELYIRLFVWSEFTWKKFAGYQLLGYMQYSIFNFIFNWNPGAEIVYKNIFPNGRIPVETYDTIYSCHYVLFLLFVLLGRCLKITGQERQSTYAILDGGHDYESDSRKSLARITILGCTFGFTIFSLIMALCGVFTWIVFYVMLSYPILIMAWVEVVYFIKFFDDLEISHSPSIKAIFTLHFIGGLACVIQMACTGANYGDWYLFIGNLPKLGLALAAVVYTVAVLLRLRQDSSDFLGNDAEPESYRRTTDEQIATLRRQGREYYRLGDLGQTIKAYESLQKIVDFAEKKRISEFLKVFRQLRTHMKKAMDLVSKKKYPEARQSYLKCETLLVGSNFPNELSNNLIASTILLHIGSTYQSEENLDEAITKYIAAIARNPRNYEAQKQTGLIYFVYKDYPAALRYLRDALNLSNADQYEIRAHVTLIETKLKEQRESQNSHRQDKYWKEYADRQEQTRKQQQEHEKFRQEQRKKEQEHEKFRQEQRKKEQEHEKFRQEQRKKQQEQESRNQYQQQRRTNEKPKDNYEILGVSRTATPNEIRKAYRDKLKMYHPDKHPDHELKEYFTKQTEELNRAYNAIMTTSKR